jgi:hypothetical protein
VGSFACIGGGLFGLDISSMSGILTVRHVFAPGRSHCIDSNSLFRIRTSSCSHSYRRNARSPIIVQVLEGPVWQCAPSCPYFPHSSDSDPVKDSRVQMPKVVSWRLCQPVLYSARSQLGVLQTSSDAARLFSSPVCSGYLVVSFSALRWYASSLRFRFDVQALSCSSIAEPRDVGRWTYHRWV